MERHLPVSWVLRQLMDHRGLSAERLARASGGAFGARAVSYWLAGSRSPNLADLAVICDIFNVSADVFLGRAVLPTEESYAQAAAAAAALAEKHGGEPFGGALRLPATWQPVPCDSRLWSTVANPVEPISMQLHREFLRAGSHDAIQAVVAASREGLWVLCSSDPQLLLGELRYLGLGCEPVDAAGPPWTVYRDLLLELRALLPATGLRMVPGHDPDEDVTPSDSVPA